MELHKRAFAGQRNALDKNPKPIVSLLGVFCKCLLLFIAEFKDFLQPDLKFQTAINPVVAYEVRPGLPIAAGVLIDQAEINSEQGLSRRQTSGDYFLFEGDDLSIGYNLGLLWKINECFTFGATFHSAVTLGFDGETNISGRNINGSDIPALGMRAPVTYSTKAQCRMIITALSPPIWTVISSLSALDGSGRNTPSSWAINSAMARTNLCGI